MDEESGEGFSGKNTLLVKALAISLNQYVRAADEGQVFNTSQTTLDRFLSEKAVDFGTWEGRIYLFSPDGSMSRE